MKPNIIFIALLLATLLILNTSATGQSMEGDTKLGIGFGYGHELEELGLGINANYAIRSEIRIAADFFYYLVDDDEFLGETIEYTAYELNANVHYLFINEENVIVYGLTGLNYLSLEASTSTDNVTVSSDESEFGLNLGGGFEYLTSEQLSIFGEIKYAISEFDQFLFSAGIRYKL